MAPKLRIKKEECGCCAGIQWGGDYPRECLNCGGSGFIFITEHDRIIDYPGGPFRGSYPGKFQKLENMGIPDYEWEPMSSRDECFEIIAEQQHLLNVAKKMLGYYANGCSTSTYAKDALAYIDGTMTSETRSPFGPPMMTLEYPNGGTDSRCTPEPGQESE